MSSLIRGIALAGAIVLGVTACQSAPRPAPEPIASALLVRNTSPFDVNVYALRGNGDREWLTTVPAKGQRSLPVEPRVLLRGDRLIIQAQAIGSNSIWTSDPLGVNPNLVAMLDLATKNSGDLSKSLFYTLDLAEVQAAMR
jgi:hypothetical protein